MTIDGRHLAVAAAGVALGVLGMLLAGSFSSTSAAEPVRPTGANTILACEPAQRAVLRHTVVDGALQVETECAGVISASGVADSTLDLAAVAPVARPVAASQAVSSAVSSPRAATRTTAAKSRTAESWKKTALVIGGSAGTGAGIGALAGGKKGALIGAAVGGGAASLYEAIRR